MKLSFSFLLLVCASLAPAILGEYAVRTLLNNGYALPSGEVCAVSEWSSITIAMDVNQVDQSRNLRTAERRLDPYWCSCMCTGFCPGSCHLAFSACSNTRRREAEFTKQEPSAINGGGRLRELVSDSCSKRISDINDALDALDSLSSGCQALVDAPRDFACYDVVEVIQEECEIMSFNLWDAATDTVSVPNFTDGGFFCKNDFQINIEAVADDCVKKVHFHLTGPNDYVEDDSDNKALFMVFQNPNKSISGETLNAGNYTLTAFPQNNMDKFKTLSFTVLDDC